MSNYPSNFLKTAICVAGDKVLPPALDVQAGVGRLSQEKGFPPITAKKLSAGGLPPQREDFNGVLYLLSQHTLWTQAGGEYKYSSALEYEPPCTVWHNGTKYHCVKANGSANPVTPGTNTAYWQSDLDRIYPVGAIYISTSGTNPGTLFGGTWQALEQGRVLVGAGANWTAGAKGGAASHTLTVDEMPTHSHAVSVSEAGGHKHTRGDMNITGRFISGGQGLNWQDGAFYATDTDAPITNADDGNSRNKVTGFDAASSWTGSTSSAGGHVHTATASNAGAGTSFSTMPPYLVVHMFVRTA